MDCGPKYSSTSEVAMKTTTGINENDVDDDADDVGMAVGDRGDETSTGGEV